MQASYYVHSVIGPSVGGVVGRVIGGIISRVINRGIGIVRAVVGRSVCVVAAVDRAIVRIIRGIRVALGGVASVGGLRAGVVLAIIGGGVGLGLRAIGLSGVSSVVLGGVVLTRGRGAEGPVKVRLVGRSL